MHPILFSIGRVNIYTHGLMIALGALAGGALIFYLAKREGLSRKFLFDILVISLFMGIVGARITYLIFYYYQFPNWQEMFYIWYGGLVSFGGIIFGFLTAGLILKRRGENVLKWFDVGVIGLLLGWSIGRIGCLLSGDVLGIISHSKIAIRGRIPATLLESIWCLILAGLLFLLITRGQKFINKFDEGIIFALGLIGYFVGRFIIDFWREDSSIGLGFLNLKTGQLVSIIIVVGLMIFFFFYFQHKKGAQNVQNIY